MKSREQPAIILMILNERIDNLMTELAWSPGCAGIPAL